jgi:hypothetical protein
MKRSTRWISLAWIALVLNVLSPVVGYARASGTSGLLSVELCSAAGAQRIVINGNGSSDATKAHSVAPHCVYCPGFAANFALGGSLSVLPAPARKFAQVQTFEPQTFFVRRSVRVAQPRAPPETLI